MNIEYAKEILSKNKKTLYGIFGFIESSGYFPTREILNDFLLGGCDPCDQDARMSSWKPFKLSESEFEEVLSWWLKVHPKTKVSDLGVNEWADWSYEIIEME